MLFVILYSLFSVFSPQSGQAFWANNRGGNVSTGTIPRLNPIFLPSKYCRDLKKCATRIESTEKFKALASTVKMGARSVPVVKLVLDKRNPARPQLFFINTKEFSYHHDFVSRHLGDKVSLSDFNQNYIVPFDQRNYVLASLSLWRSPEETSSASLAKGGLYLLELWNGDKLEAQGVKELYKIVQKALLISGREFLYHPMGHEQEKAIEKDTSISYIKTDALYAGIEYLPMNEGETIGRLTVVADGADVCLDHTHIALFKRTPNDVGMVAGIITEELQTPLGHINVKSMNRGTPNISLKEASKKLSSYIGKVIKLKALGDRYEIEEISEDRAYQEIGLFWENRRPQLNYELTSKIKKINNTRFLNLETIFLNSRVLSKDHKELLGVVGAKATNLALLKHLSREKSEIEFSVPSAMGVPYNFYDLFMHNRQKGLDETDPEKVTSPIEIISEILSKNGVLGDAQDISICKMKPELTRIRTLISKSQVPEEMLDLFKKYIFDEENSPIHIKRVAKLRLRSSTNSEDLEGFNGAGLYNSTGIWFYEKGLNAEGEEVRLSTKPLSWQKIKEKLIKEIPYIYSSAWNDRAFEEREWYGINGDNHLKVKVGMALHDGFPFKGLDGQKNEMANGVAITQNIFDAKESYKLYINSQHFDLAVTNPPSASDLAERDPMATLQGYKTEEILVSTMSADDNKGEGLEFWKEWSYEVLSRSSVLKSDSVLKESKQEVQRLSYVLRRLQKRFAQTYGKNGDFAIDVEWKLVGPERRLWIKQARPFSRPGELDGMNSMRSLAPNREDSNEGDDRTTLGPKLP